MRSGRATTRGALQQATGLSRATVGQRLDRLFRAGWLREGAGGPVDSPLGGRPSITLEFDDAHAVGWPPISTPGTAVRRCSP